MEKIEKLIQSKHICNASILRNRNDICNAYMNELYEIPPIKRSVKK